MTERTENITIRKEKVTATKLRQTFEQLPRNDRKPVPTLVISIIFITVFMSY